MIRYYKHSITDLIQKLHHIQSSPWEAVEDVCCLQLALVQKITYVERRIKECKRLISESRREFTLRQSKERAVKLKANIGRLEQQLQEYKQIACVLRSIGDGLAFTYLPSSHIRPLTSKEHAGFLSGKSGFRWELTLLKQMCDSGLIGILNDVTNCLRYGDITAFDKNGRAVMAEIKSTVRDNPQQRRQLQKAEGIATYLTTGKGKDIYLDGYDIVRVDAHAPELHYLDEINQLIAQARIQSLASRQVEPGLMYLAVKSTVQALQDIQVCLDQTARSMTTPLMFVLNEHKYDTLGYYPLTLSIADPQAVYEFYAGDLCLVVIADLGVVFRRASAKGYQLKFIAGDHSVLEVVDQNQDTEPTNRLTVGYHLFGRVGLEFLSLEWLTDEIIHSMGRAPTFISTLDNQ